MPVTVTPVPVPEVSLGPGWWRDRVEASRRVGLPALLERFEEQGVLDNFRRLSGKDAPRSTPRRGWWFTDSDLYKWMEAAAWWLAQDPGDSTLRGWLDQAVEVVLGAQDAGGYLNTNFGDEDRFRSLDWSHELYCLGHLIEAAVAHRQATGEDSLIEAASRFASLAERELARREESDGHPGIELALVALARETGEERWLTWAADLCGRVRLENPERLSGHAVRALYFACALTDLAAETGTGWDLVERQWRSMVEAQSYVTGAVGGRWLGESVGRPFELPHEGSYAETCASVAVAMWAQRMLAATGDAAYADHLELVLHNGVLAGVSLAGDEWFYANPLATAALDEPDPWEAERFEEAMPGPLPLRRWGWRDVTCCPPNVLRTMASLGGRVYGTAGNDLWVQLFVASTVRHGEWVLRQASDLPWEGRVDLVVEGAPADPSALVIRLPGWSAGKPTLSVNGKTVPGAGHGFVRIERRWSAGDRVGVDLDVSPHAVVANPRVEGARGSVAIRRGPLVYCVEGIDHPDADVHEIGLRPETLAAQWRADLLGGVMTVTGEGRVLEEPWGPLYRRLADPRIANDGPERAVPVTAVPYYAWANRGLAAMTVWMRLASGAP